MAGRKQRAPAYDPATDPRSLADMIVEMRENDRKIQETSAAIYAMLEESFSAFDLARPLNEPLNHIEALVADLKAELPTITQEMVMTTPSGEALNAQSRARAVLQPSLFDDTPDPVPSVPAPAIVPQVPAQAVTEAVPAPPKAKAKPAAEAAPFKARTERIKPEIIEILRDVGFADNHVVLNTGQLPRKTYEAVNDVLERFGGKWNRKARAHVFGEDPRPLIDLVVQTGEMPEDNPLAFFATPDEICRRMVAMAALADLPDDACILEPSAGEGAIVEAILATRAFLHKRWQIEVVELDPKRAAKLRARYAMTAGVRVTEGSALDLDPTRLFDAILLNPPFALVGDPQAYITHIEDAFDHLKPDAILVAITPPSWQRREDRKATRFRELVQRYGSSEDIAAGAFKASGTEIATTIVALHKPEDYQ